MDNKSINDVLNEFVTANQPQQVVVEPTTVTTNVDPLLSTDSQKVNDLIVEKKVIDNTTDVVPNTEKPVEQTSDNVNWDSFVPDTTGGTPTQSDINWSEVGKAIGIKTEVKSSNEVVSYIGTLEKTIQDLKSTPVLSDKVPNELQEALKIAENGGDYLAYLDVSKLDYTKIDPVEIFEDEVAEMFYNPDGTFREDEYETYLESINPMEKMLRGKQIQRELVSQQNSQKQFLQQKANAEKAESLKKLETSLNQFTKVGQFEVTPKVKKQLFDDLATGQFMKELGININGSHDWDKLKETYFKAKYFDAVQSFNEKRAKTTVLRDTINDLSNSTVTRATTLENPTQTRAPKTGIDLYLDNLAKK